MVTRVVIPELDVRLSLLHIQCYRKKLSIHRHARVKL